jgi:hypothetical protein
LFSVVIESEQGRSSFDLGLNHARGSNFEEVEVRVGFAERGQESGTDFENGRSVLSTDDEVTRVGEKRSVRVLFETY